MTRRITLVEINKLLSHEEISISRVKKIQKDILERGFLVNPVVVDGKTLTVLDGHHRVQALRSIGVKFVPAYSVNYGDDVAVRVYLRRKKILMKIVKDYVRHVALSKKLFPTKTTRHLIKQRPRNIKYKLLKLF